MDPKLRQNVWEHANANTSSLYGNGCTLLQDYGHGKQRLVQCGSIFLTGAETRYATIELELLAITWAMAKCWLYLFDLQRFTLMTDHPPLILILNHYTLDPNENPRLLWLKEKVSPYSFTVVWHAGKSLCILDALSWAPFSLPTPEEEEECITTATHVQHIVTHTTTSTDDQSMRPIIDDDRTLQEVRTAAAQDPAYTHLLSYVSNGFPTNRYILHASTLPYWKWWNNV